MEQIVTKIEELSGRRRLVYINGEQAFAIVDPIGDVLVDV